MEDKKKKDKTKDQPEMVDSFHNIGTRLTARKLPKEKDGGKGPPPDPPDGSTSSGSEEGDEGEGGEENIHMRMMNIRGCVCVCV